MGRTGQREHAIARRAEATFITTGMPLSASIRAANSEPRYDSRLYRWLLANMAIAGVSPHLYGAVIAEHISRCDRRVWGSRFSQYVRDKPCLGCMMKGCNWKLKLFCQLTICMSCDSTVATQRECTHSDYVIQVDGLVAMVRDLSHLSGFS